MGKSRGKGKYRGPRGKPGDDDSSEEEFVGGQNANVGLLPPSDSDDESEVEVEAAAEEKPEKKQGGQSVTVGEMPPSDSDSEEDSEKESEEESAKPVKAKGKPVLPDEPRKKKDEDDPEEIRKDIERLELIKRKREEARLKRIADEGWDRFSPESETNRRPGAVPKDHPAGKA